MTKQERFGYYNITGKRYSPPKSAHSIVRIYYRSEGGEILCCDSERLTCDRAETLARSLGASVRSARYGRVITMREDAPSDAFDVEILIADNAERMLPSHNARRVVFPSQRTEPVERIEREDVAA